MITLEISFDQLLDTIDRLSEDQKQIVLERLHSGTKQDIKRTIPKKRVAGLEEGMVKMSDDFTDPLTDRF